MWKIAGWLAKTAAAGLIVSFLSIWTTGYVVNSYVETLLKQYKIPLDEKPFAMSGVWGGLWGANPELKQEAKRDSASSAAGAGDGQGSEGSPASEGTDGGPSSAEKRGSTDASSATGSSSSSDMNGAASGGSSSGAADGKADSGEDTPLAVDAYGDINSGPLTDIGGGTGPKGNSGATSNGGTGGTEAGEASKDGMAMSTDQLNEAKSKMSEADKEQLFNLMMKKLPQDAWQRISGLMENGLTNEEMTEVQQLIAQYLDRTEYDSMMKILKKY